jgi:hypothetical protein
MSGLEPARALGDILAGAGTVVNDRADDISVFIDLSVLIRNPR